MQRISWRIIALTLVFTIALPLATMASGPAAVTQSTVASAPANVAAPTAFSRENVVNMPVAAVSDRDEGGASSELRITDPYVSDPVVPADTEGLPPASMVEPAVGAPQEMPSSFPLPTREQPEVADPVAQLEPVAVNMPTPITNWEGISGTAVYPPDTDGQVGPNHYVQIVNSAAGAQVRVWDKTGVELYDYGLESLWPETDPCNVDARGDPVVLYDQLSDRWLLTQFVGGTYGYYECIAVSRGSDPTNLPDDWWLYSFNVHPTKFNDYPKLGIWPDGYYMSANQFAPGWAGAGVWVFDRDAMLDGQAATFQYFDLEPAYPSLGGFLPSNLMGDTLPPDGAPNYFAASDVVGSAVRIFEFHTDWDTPANTTFTLVKDVPVEPFDVNMCGGARSCIPQPDTAQGLDAISDRLMMHLWYRNFGDHEVLVVNQTVDVGGDHAGVRWYEIRDPGVDAYVFQQGTYAPDEHHRWMGSIAMDRVGNIALGYSISSETVYPGIRYTGRLASDPLGVMAQGEETVINGSGSQTGSGARWGDYSAMSVDPVDDCTFWYTQEYYETTAPVLWQTRVASFRFPECEAATGKLVGEITDASTSDPIEKARVTAETNPAYVTLSRPDGSYGFAAIPTGTYTVTATAYGFVPAEVSGVSIAEDVTTTEDFALTPLATYVVSGTVTDATTGWPLYASIDIEADGYLGAPVWTDPVSGTYSVTLAANTVHTFTVSAWVNGYSATVRTVGPLVADSTEDFALDADLGTCAAPGYAPVSTVYLEDFESSDGGYTGETDWEWGTPTSWPFSCASGDNCWGTNLTGDYSANTDQALTSPIIDLSSYVTGTVLTANWQQAWYMEPGFDYASAEVNIDGAGWTEVWSSSSEDNDWTPMSLDVSDAASGTVQLRWRITSDSGYEIYGYFVDDVEITEGCAPTPGGLVVGNVYDAATSSPQVGATVENDSGESTTAVATPLDAAVDDAFYTLFSPDASHVFTATGGYGYLPDVQTVTVVQSDTVRQDFYLPDATYYTVEGVVRDANTGWPLYAYIDVGGYPGEGFWTDPVSATYSITLAEGGSYNFIVAPWVDGYDTANIVVGPLMSDTIQDLVVGVDAVACDAPGYEGTTTSLLYENFNDVTFPPTGWALYTVGSSPSQDWHRYDFGGGEGAARHVWNTSESDDDWLVTPQLTNLPADATLSYWEVDPNPPGSYYDEHNVMITTDANPDPNTATYTLLREADAETSWTNIQLDLSAYAGQDVYLAFNYVGYDTDVWYLDEVEVFEASCAHPIGGGLVVGHVYDANTAVPMDGATVANEDGYAATTGATSDTAVDEAFYTIFSPAGTKTFTGTMTLVAGYGADVHPAVNVVVSDTVGLENFELPAGILGYTPYSMSVTLYEGMSTTLPFTLSNSGGAPIDFSLLEWRPAFNPTTRMRGPARPIVVPDASFDSDLVSAWSRVAELSGPLAPGDVLDSWDTGLTMAWGTAYDRLNDTVWVNSPCAGWGGDCRAVEYRTDGTPTGRWYGYPWNPTYGPADMVYNPNTGMIWVMDVASDNCVHELDPDSGWTGDTICGFTDISQRGLSYNPDTDVFYTGRWDYGGCANGTVCQAVIQFQGETWASPGEVIAIEPLLGINISGLAYHSDVDSLFVAVSGADRVYEYEIATWTEVVSFTVSGFGGRGADINCAGNLWMANANDDYMVLVDSDRPAELCPTLDWLSEDPITGTIGVAPATFLIDVTFDAGAPSVTQPGEYTGMLRVNNNSPGGPVQIPVTMTVEVEPIYELYMPVMMKDF